MLDIERKETPMSQQTVNRNFRMSEDLAAALDGAARFKGMTASQVFRNALRTYLAGVAEEVELSNQRKPGRALELSNAQAADLSVIDGGPTDAEIASAWASADERSQPKPFHGYI